MPEVTTCPDCEKKLKVPDNLLGKKVRCPGCSVMFTARADGAEEEPAEEERPAEKPKARASAISTRKREARDEEEEEKPRARARLDDEDEKPRARTRRDEEEEEKPRARARRDDDEEDEKPRGGGIRRREDVDDRPSRRDRDDDDRRSRRDRDDYEDDEDHPRRGSGPEAKGWRGTKIGVFLVIIANWMHLSGLGIGAIGAGTMLLLGGAVINSIMSSGQPGDGDAAAAGGMLILGIIFFGLFILLLGVGNIVQLVGQGLCMQVPARRGSAMRGLAIAAFACAILAFLLNVGGSAMSRGGGGNYGSGLSGLLNTASFVCWVLFLRAVAVELRDPDLGGKFLMYLIGYIIFVVVAVILMIVAVCAGAAAVGSSIQRNDGQGAAAAGGVMMVVMVILGGLVALTYLGLTVWYVMLLQRLRAVIEGHLSRM